MKKLFTLLMAATVVVALAACGGDEDTSAPAVDETPVEVDVNVEAGDKEFDIVATNFDFASDQDLVVKKGDKVTINLENEEGVHGLKIDGLGVEGGLGETVEFEATEAGTYQITCSIPCGEGHNDMQINLIVID